jgi:hypothetical protein
MYRAAAVQQKQTYEHPRPPPPHTHKHHHVSQPTIPPPTNLPPPPPHTHPEHANWTCTTANPPEVLAAIMLRTAALSCGCSLRCCVSAGATCISTAAKWMSSLHMHMHKQAPVRISMHHMFAAPCLHLKLH